MGNYVPTQNPAQGFTFQASASITGADPVEVASDGKVHRANGTGRYVGIAAFDVTAGQSLNVYVGSTEFSGPAEGAVAAGDDLAASNVPGRQVRTAPPGAEVIGLAFTPAADGAAVKWLQTR